MTSSEPPIQSWSLRSLPPLTWAMVLLGLVFVVTTINGRSNTVLGMIAGLAPFLFAATVTYMKPSDPRFLYGAALIGVGRGLAVMATLIASQGVVRGEFADTLFAAAAFIDTPIELVGLALIGLAAGGVHTRIGFTIGAIGVVLAVVRLVGAITFSQSVPDPTAVSINIPGLVVGLLTPVAWGFLVAAAFESRRRLLLLGSIVLLAVEAVLIFVVAFSLAVDVGILITVVNVLQIGGWLLMALSPLRLEMGTQRPLNEEVAASG